MVRALLSGSKTQTRRIVKPQPENAWVDDGFGNPIPCPYGDVFDRLWVKETYWRDDEDGAILYAANPVDYELVNQNKHESGLAKYNWKPSIFMRREYSRITLEITSVRVGRLQDISESDALAEGIELDDCGHAIRKDDPIAWGGAKTAYAELWESINGAGSWNANPFVWVIEFKRVIP